MLLASVIYVPPSLIFSLKSRKNTRATFSMAYLSTPCRNNYFHGLRVGGEGSERVEREWRARVEKGLTG